jgi:serine protease Do
MAHDRSRSPASTSRLAALALWLVPVACSGDDEAAETAPAPVEIEASAPIQLAAATATAPAPAAATVVDYDPRKSLAPMIKTVSPSVVSIRAVGREGGIVLSLGQRSEGTGSGFVISSDGLVATNHHVIANAEKLQVRMADGRKLDARVVGSDPATDLALLQLENASGVAPATLGASAPLEVGDWVVAIGSPLGLEHSASVGIVSAKGRGSLGLYQDSFLDFLQTDADIAPGSSGGPLFDLEGRVVGITTAVNVGGAGFAIPIDQAKDVLDQLKEHGHIARGYLGARSKAAEDEHGGARIDEVDAGTPAADSGLREGDVIVELDGDAIDNFTQLRDKISRLKPGHTVLMKVKRGGETVELSAVLGDRSTATGNSGGGIDRRRSRPREVPFSPDLKDPFSPFFAPSEPPDPPEIVVPPASDRLGVEVREVADGLEVVGIEPGSVAEKLDLRAGDVIHRVNGKSVGSAADVRKALDGTRRVEVQFSRSGAQHDAAFERS